jgi:hypothetical protein
MRFAPWFAVAPALAILGGVAFVNRVEPLVLGMPLVLAWIVGWVAIGAGAMAVLYARDPANASDATKRDRGER